jgi:uncharacterized repeat protein (TIGR03803 family)
MAYRFQTRAAALALIAAVPAYGASSVRPVHRFASTGKGTQSQFALGATPVEELLQASDGNFYGTTTYGGSGVCTNAGGTIIGCGTIFQMTPKGAVTVLYSFFYDTSTDTAPGGVFPTAGLIQGKDGTCMAWPRMAA